MSEWKTARLHEIADVRVSNVDKKSLPHEQAVFLCNYMDVYSNDYITSELPFMQATAAPSQIERFKVQHGDVMITKDSETPEDIGIPAVAIENIPNLVCGYHLALLKPDTKQIDGRYLAKQLGTSATANYFACRAAGSTRYGLSTGTINDTPIPLAPLPQQRRIATILTTLDEVIEATEKLVEKHQQIKAGLMHDLFTRGLWTRPELARGDHQGTPAEATAQEGQLRPTPEEAPGLYQDSPIGLVPKEWDVNELRNWLSYLSYGFTNPMPESEDGPYMVTAADVTGGGIQYETCRRTTRLAYERLLTEKSRPKVGDVLLTKDGTLGRIAVVERENVCINQSVAVLRPANPNHSKFLAEMLSSPRWQQKMVADAGGSTIKHIYITVIDKMLVGWPVQSSEVDAIVAKIDSASQHLELEKLHLAKLRQQKHGLMHDLLTGRVRVTDS